MEGIDLHIPLEKRFPDVPKPCLLRCPRLKGILAQLEALDEGYLAIADSATGDGLEEKLKEFKNGLPKELADAVDLESSAVFSRARLATVMDQINVIRGVAETEITDFAKVCDAPFEAMGIDSAGRKMGVLVCRSGEVHDGDSSERADVFRYPDS